MLQSSRPSAWFRSIAHAAPDSSERAAVILVATAVCLTIAEFASRDAAWIATTLRAIGADDVARRITSATTTGPHAEFWHLAVWAGAQIGGYVVIPAVLVRAVWRQPFSAFGLRISGTATHAGPYALLYLAALPFLVGASFTTEFRARYPFYDLAPHESLWPYLCAWWVLYALQFVALESFFRGFVLHGLAPRLGPLAIAVMIVPYNMLHYGKPMPEAIAAIVGGAVMGWLALRTRSVFWGAALHIAVALTMDVLALTHAGRIF